MSLLLALLAQIGPFPSVGDAPVSPLPREDQQHQQMERLRRAEEQTSVPIPDNTQPQAAVPAAPAASATTAPAASSAGRVGAPAPDRKLAACLGMIDVDAGGAARAAQDWLKQAKGAERAEAGQCLGAALAAQQDFANARTAFIAARDAAAPADHTSRAHLGAMAGSAAMGETDAAGALALLDIARTDAGAAGDTKLASGIATDRARALVSLKRDAEAATALADARTADPANAEAWLLSATLSRRVGKLAEAQAQIEEAARLLPVDPEIGLEAGVIAVLAGHDQAARKSWEAVVRMAPKTDAAATANSYLAQLGSQTGAQPEATR